MPQPLSSGLRKEKQTMSPITRACDMCRQKKVRCDVVSGVCTQCIKNKTPCNFTPISTKRAPRRSGRDKRVEELEKRLKSMEEMMKRPSSNQQSDSSDAEFSNNSIRLGGSLFSTQSEAGLSDSGTSLDPASSVTGENSQGSDFGIPTPEEHVPHVPNFDDAGSKSRIPGSLPPRDEVLNLVEQSFEGFHPAYPLFDKSRFMSIFENLDIIANDPGRWACLNIVLALTSQFEHGTAENIQEDIEAWQYFQTAFALVGQLMTMHVTLWSVQALLGMALVLQGTPNQGPVSLLISASMRLAHRMGLHKRCLNPNIPPAEVEERRRVFWIAYSLDKDRSLQMRQPSAQDDDDMDVELPSQYDSSMTYSSEPPGTSLLNFRARLAMIQGQIYKRLYSVKASNQAIAERVEAATELEAKLQSWRASVPIDLMQDYYGPFLQMPTSGPSRHPVMLQLVYFNSLALVYSSLPTLPRYRDLQRTGETTDFQLISSELTYATEARKAIELLPVTPRRRNACVWASLYIFVTASSTLLKNIISDPSNPMALADLNLIEPLLTVLGMLSNSSKGSSKAERINGMHRSCLELFERANMAVETTTFANMDWD